MTGLAIRSLSAFLNDSKVSFIALTAYRVSARILNTYRPSSEQENDRNACESLYLFAPVKFLLPCPRRLTSWRRYPFISDE